MAAPADVTLERLTGTWALNSSLSDDPCEALELQDVSWLVRKTIAAAPVTITITQTTAPETGVTRIASKQSALGRTTSDVRVLDWETEDVQTHPLFGSLIARSRWVHSGDVEETFLVEDARSDESLIEVRIEGTSGGWVSHQVWRFENIEGDRYHTRRAVISKADRQAKIRMVYDWQSDA